MHAHTSRHMHTHTQRRTHAQPHKCSLTKAQPQAGRQADTRAHTHRHTQTHTKKQQLTKRKQSHRSPIWFEVVTIQFGSSGLHESAQTHTHTHTHTQWGFRFECSRQNKQQTRKRRGVAEGTSARRADGETLMNSLTPLFTDRVCGQETIQNRGSAHTQAG